MALYVHNTLTRAREAFTPGDPRRVTMYVCGPTVYNFAHIGNARPYVVFDVLARLLRRSFDLVYARNVTDVDDKINDAAAAEGVPSPTTESINCTSWEMFTLFPMIQFSMTAPALIVTLSPIVVGP